MAIHASECQGETVFTHFDEHTGKRTIIASQRLVEWCNQNKPRVSKIPVDPDFAVFCLKHRGVENHRLARIKGIHLDDPMLSLRWFDRSVLLADGTHRYVKAHLLGRKWLNTWLLKQAQWKPFIVEGAPEVHPDQLLNSFSGIK